MSDEMYKLDGLMDKLELPSFDEISNMTSEISFCNNEKIGNYRLSTNLLRKIANDREMTSSGLIVLLFFLQICDAENHISEFNYRELTERKRNNEKPILSVKSFYNALKLLKKRGYINYADSAYKTRNITILGNDVCAKESFLNLNYDSLVFGTLENDTFLSFPVKGKVLYLLLLTRAYSIRKHGSRIDLKKLAKELHVAPRAFEYYLSKVELLIGKIPRDKNKFTNKKRWTITIPFFNRTKFAPKEHLLNGQANYFGRIFDRLVSTYTSLSVPLYMDNQDQTLKQWYFTLMKKYAALGPANVFKVFEYVISENAGLTLGSYHDASIILANA